MTNTYLSSSNSDKAGVGPNIYTNTYILILLHTYLSLSNSNKDGLARPLPVIESSWTSLSDPEVGQRRRRRSRPTRPDRGCPW